MSETKIFENLVGEFSLAKTLRFELKPVGKTLENFKENLHEKEKQRDEDYEKLKEMLDELHEEFITDALSTVEMHQDRKDFLPKFDAQKSSKTAKKRFGKNARPAP